MIFHLAMEKKAIEDKACDQNADNKLVKQLNSIYPATLCDAEFAVIFTDAGKCRNVKNLQECDANDKSSLYGSSPPMQATYDFLKVLETETHCAGLCGRCFGKYLFSNKDNL